MKRIWHGMGKWAFWLLWPLLFIYLWFTKRTRVLVMVDDEMLPIKGWLSSNAWGLPGGGIHLRESPRAGAARELKEETGITVGAAQLRELHARRARSDHGHRFFVHTFLLELSEKPELTLQKREIIDATWVNWRKLDDLPKVMREVHHALASWRQSR